jgi:hypothetical protein
MCAGEKREGNFIAMKFPDLSRTSARASAGQKPVGFHLNH